MTEKKPPLGDNGQLLGEFAQALQEGRRLDPNAPKVAPDPALQKTLGALEGGEAHFTNPMTDKPKR
ncbi:MAG: hypothetical protein ACAH80_05290 [Alphaproteobacteria bacterium]